MYICRLLKFVTSRRDDQHERVVSNHQALSVGFYVNYIYNFKDPTSGDISSNEYKSYRQLNDTMQSPSEWIVENMKIIIEKMEIIYINI